MTTPPAVSARQHLALTATQDKALQRWAAGDFVADYVPTATPARTLAEVPVAEQPAMLDRAALTFCLADAFHPGCELTWPMRHATMYRAPFRIKPRPGAQPEPSYGPTLTPQAALAATGPLYLQSPGDLTRWMAVPWHADTASCRSGYSRAGHEVYDPYVPTFWPARVPNHVLTLADYRIVVDPAQPMDKRREAFERRASWFRPLTGDMPSQRNQMVTVFGRMGVVEERPGVPGSAEFPPRMLVESEPGMNLTGVPPERNLRVVHVPEGQDLAALAAEEGAAWPEDAVVGYDDKGDRFPDHG